jgi:rod shape-determining protein MreB
MICGNGAVVDHPARVPIVAQRHRQFETADWCHPVRHGIVVDEAGCTRLIRRLLRDAASGLRETLSPREILIGTPVAATALQRQAATDAVRAAAGCPVRTMDGPLATAAGCGFPLCDPGPRLLMDIGAEIVEVVAIREARVAYAWSLEYRPEPDAGGLPAHVSDRLASAVTDIIDCLPGRQRSAVRRQGLTLTGGGARNGRLAARLTAELRLTVSAAPDPAWATIRGLARVFPVLAVQSPGQHRERGFDAATGQGRRAGGSHFQYLAVTDAGRPTATHEGTGLE